MPRHEKRRETMKNIIIPLVLVLALVASLLAGCLGTPIRGTYQAIVTDGVKQFEGGTLRYIENVPFLSISGSYYDMGLQYGVLLKGEVQEMMEQHLAGLKASIFSRLPWYIRPFGSIILHFKLKSMEKTLPQKYLDELKGLVDETGVSYNDVLFGAFGAELLTFGCSSFVKKTPQGIIHGRSLDYQFPFLGRAPVVVEYAPKGKLKYTTVGFVGFPGALSGMNEEGITVSLDAAPMYKTNSKRTIPICYQMREILEKACTIEEVDELLKGYQTEQGWLLIVGSLRDEMGVVYDIAGKEIVKNVMRGDHITATNYFLDEELRHKYMTIGCAGVPGNIARWEILEEKISKLAASGVNQAIDALGNADFYDYEDVLVAGNVTTNNEGSLQSIVMCPREETIYFSSTGGYSGWGRFMQYDVKTHEASIYREADPHSKGKRFQELLDWWERILEIMVKNNQKEGVNFTRDVKEPTLFQLSFLVWAYDKNKSMLDDSKIMDKLDRAIEKYPDYSVPYLFKAKVLLEKEQFEGAINYASQALETLINFPDTRREAYEILAKAFKGLKNMEKAQYYAKQCINLLEQYAIGKDEKKAEKEMRDILAWHK